MTSPTPAPIPAGSFIANRYEIRGLLGAGTYGEVYEALDHHQNHLVAVKLLKRAVGPTPWVEAQLLTQLQSEYILRVWNADVVAGRPYLVTELATHGTVDKYMTPAGVPPKEAVRWVRHAARGAARTHDAGLLHLDIKPGNLFLEAKGEALLGDFGLAAAMDPNGHGPPVGTPATKAPEVEAGGASSRASDVYSLGATLYALLTGVYPFPRPNAPLRDLAPHISQVLAQRISKAMDDDPARRYQRAGDFDAALGNLPDPGRYWFRTDEHVVGGHHACWRGQAVAKADITVCATSGAGAKFDVTAQHQPSGRKITSACRTGVSRRELPRAIRAAIRAGS